MSACTLAIMPHSFGGIDEVLALPHLLQPCNALAHDVAEKYWANGILPREETWQWRWYQDEASPQQDWEKYRHVSLEGPGGITHITVGRACLLVDTVAKWHVARMRRELLLATIRLFDKVARTLGASRFICTHDDGLAQDWVQDGLDFDRIVAKVHDSGWRQVPTITALLTPDCDGKDYDHDLFYIATVPSDEHTAD